MAVKFVSNQAIDRLFALRKEGKIGWRAFGVGVALACYFDAESGRAWPSRTTLAAMTGIAERNISASIRELESSGFIVTATRPGQSNVYRLTPVVLDTPDDSDRGVGIVKTPLSATDKTPLIVLTPRTINEPTKNHKRISKVAMTDTGFTLPSAIRESWAAAYPGVDIDRESARAFAWCKSNPRKAPKKDFGRFLNGWLSRAKPNRPEKACLDTMDAYELSAADVAIIQAWEDEQARRAANA